MADDQAETVSVIICGGGQCPTCDEGRSLFGPCEDCCEYFDQHDRFPRRKKRTGGNDAP